LGAASHPDPGAEKRGKRREKREERKEKREERKEKGKSRKGGKRNGKRKKQKAKRENKVKQKRPLGAYRDGITPHMGAYVTKSQGDLFGSNRGQRARERKAMWAAIRFR
jgi:hypothetical protein